MSKKANPTLVGLFVIVGIVIAVATVLLLGSGQFFTTKTRYVLYFEEESVNGLSKGAPVKFKGVTIGAVDEILLHYDKSVDSIQIPVVIHLDANRILENLSTPSVGEMSAYVDLVNHLVGRLETDSFVTGRLYIGLRYDPESDTKRKHGPLEGTDSEIPTEPSQIQAFMNQLQSIDITGLVDSAKKTLANLDAALTNIDTKQINSEVVLTIQTARRKIMELDLDNVLLSVQTTMTNANNALASITAVAEDFNGVGGLAKEKLGPLVSEVTNTTHKAVATLESIRSVADELRVVLKDKSPLHRKLITTLDELSLLTRSVRELSDKINRNPRMFLTGKPRPGR